MKLLDRFGYWCLRDGWWYLTLVILLTVGMWLYSQPKSVTIDAKEWECSVSGTKGIDAICMEYRHKRMVP